jgi:hypothetical protein
MEFTDIKELRKLMAGNVNKFEFEENVEDGEYNKALMTPYAALNDKYSGASVGGYST